jgi:hypothetical protein
MTDYGPIECLGVCPPPRASKSNAEAEECFARARCATAQAQTASGPYMSAPSVAAICSPFAANTQHPTRDVASPYNRPIAFRPVASYLNASTNAASSRYVRRGTDSASDAPAGQLESEDEATEDEATEDEARQDEPSEDESMMISSRIKPNAGCYDPWDRQRTCGRSSYHFSGIITSSFFPDRNLGEK